jgi:hypothetical protein
VVPNLKGTDNWGRAVRVSQSEATVSDHKRIVMLLSALSLSEYRRHPPGTGKVTIGKANRRGYVAGRKSGAGTSMDDLLLTKHGLRALEHFSKLEH